jgi:type II secretory pathway component GspD/PulD (secretin)
LIDIAVTLVEVDASSGSGLSLLDIGSPQGLASLDGTVPLGDLTSGNIDQNGFQVSLSLFS